MAGLWVLSVPLSCYVNSAKPLVLSGPHFPNLKFRGWTGLSSYFISYIFKNPFKDIIQVFSLSLSIYLPEKMWWTADWGVGYMTQIFFYSSLITYVKIYPHFFPPEMWLLRHDTVMTQKVQLAGSWQNPPNHHLSGKQSSQLKLMGPSNN